MNQQKTVWYEEKFNWFCDNYMQERYEPLALVEIKKAAQEIERLQKALKAASHIIYGDF